MFAVELKLDCPHFTPAHLLPAQHWRTTLDAEESEGDDISLAIELGVDGTAAAAAAASTIPEPLSYSIASGTEPCQRCADTSENWICLGCQAVRCSRYVNGCAARHFNFDRDDDEEAVAAAMADDASDDGDAPDAAAAAAAAVAVVEEEEEEEESHPMTDHHHALYLSFTDLSVWCYACSSYVSNPLMQSARRWAYYSKFGELSPTERAERAAAAGEEHGTHPRK